MGLVPPGTPSPAGVRRLNVLLIKPSKYDDDGYVMRYLRGVLPSNTLATMAGLTREVALNREVGMVRVVTKMLDETVERIDPKRLARRFNRSGERAVVALCGVQTNQFPRAADLALEFRAFGLPVMIGGFHVSGAIAMSPSGMPEECRRLTERGVTLVKGEIEDCWADLLRDALHGRLRRFYDVAEPPDLSGPAVPVMDRRLMRRFADPNMGTIDAGRGCPFDCSFCTIINVQGRKMRSRPVARIREMIRRNYLGKVDYYFFTDDNFSRNPRWKEIFQTLIELRRDEGIDVRFMMQVDVPSYRKRGFVELAAEAGCTQVFIGMETVNPENLPGAGKKQNSVEDYREMVDTWHERGVACHVGYIIGFPHDTPQSVSRDVISLRDEVQVDQASFFMLVPIPGSRDHLEMVLRGDRIDPDYNRYDSFHPTMDHPRMSAEEWTGAYRDAWSEFYSVEGMKSILRRTADAGYWNVFKNFLWYRYAVGVEDTHPMICGFFRRRDRRQRRPGYAVESRWAHLRRRAREMRRWARDVMRLYYDMQEVWLATRGRPRLKQTVEQSRERYQEVSGRIGDSAARARQAVEQRLAGAVDGAGAAWTRVSTASRRTRDAMTRRVLGRTSRVLLRLDPVGVRARTRSDLNRYWRQTFSKLRRGRVYRINPFGVSFNLVRDVRLCLRFNLELLASPSR